MTTKRPKSARVDELTTLGPEVLSVIPDDYLAAMGRVGAAWAILDFQLDMALWQLTQTPQMLGACVTAQVLGTPQRLRALGALLRVHGMEKERINFLNRFEQQTHDLSLKRNRAIHDAIMVGRKTGTVYRMTATVTGKALVFGMIPSTPKELTDIYEAIKDHVLQFQNFWRQTGAELEALRQKVPLSLHQIVPIPPPEAPPTS